MKTISGALMEAKGLRPYILWLDDERDPKVWVKDIVSKDILKQHLKVEWVKNYREFTTWIKKNGLPAVICFDHDLGEQQSGFDCAKYLVEYCLDNKALLPKWFIQSANPPGRANINGLLNGFKKHNY